MPNLFVFLKKVIGLAVNLIVFNNNHFNSHVLYLQIIFFSPPRGNKEVLKKRLKTFYKKHKLKAAHGHQMRETRYEYLLVIDFEATCTSSNADYQHEIIEFPMVLVDVLKKEVVRTD